MPEKLPIGQSSWPSILSRWALFRPILAHFCKKKIPKAKKEIRHLQPSGTCKINNSSMGGVRGWKSRWLAGPPWGRGAIWLKSRPAPKWTVANNIVDTTSRNTKSKLWRTHPVAWRAPAHTHKKKQTFTNLHHSIGEAQPRHAPLQKRHIGSKIIYRRGGAYLEPFKCRCLLVSSTGTGRGTRMV